MDWQWSTTGIGNSSDAVIPSEGTQAPSAGTGWPFHPNRKDRGSAVLRVLLLHSHAQTTRPKAKPKPAASQSNIDSDSEDDSYEDVDEAEEDDGMVC